MQPILEYDSEIWGLKEFLSIERVVLKFCKKVLGLSFTPTNNVIYGDQNTVPNNTFLE